MIANVTALKYADIEVFKKAVITLSRQTPFPDQAFNNFDRIVNEFDFKQYLNFNVNLLLKNQDGEILGVVNGTGIEGGVGTIIWLLIDSRFKKLGFGSILFKSACEKYKELGAHKIKLTVPEKTTVEFYKKQNMLLEGFHPNHWWNMDMWSMSKFI